MKPTIRQILFGVVILVVAITIYEGFLAIGSPQAARGLLLDNQRRGDLITISANVDIYWNLKNRLPDSLQQLQSIRESSITTITDPVSKQPYEYRVLTSPAYELCATFDQPLTQADITDIPPPPPGMKSPGTSFWLHGTGRTCYQFVAQENTSTIQFVPTQPVPMTP
jgi:hypothetical protein